MKYHYTCHHCGHSWDSGFVLLDVCEKCYSRSVSRFYVVPTADVLKAAPAVVHAEYCVKCGQDITGMSTHPNSKKRRTH